MTMTDRSLVKTTILLLVSDSVVRSMLQETLEREGYMVLATGDLGQAVAKSRVRPQTGTMADLSSDASASKAGCR
jgi:CheY-like chemotaxis protein